MNGVQEVPVTGGGTPHGARPTDGPIRAGPGHADGVHSFTKYDDIRENIDRL